MKGIIPAAGKGTRLGMGCKSLTKVNGCHLISYPLKNMKSLELEETIIVHNGNEIKDTIGNCYEGMKISYVEQKERKGIAHAVSLTEELVNGDDICIILGDIIYTGGDLKEMKDHFYDDPKRSCLFGVKRVELKEEIMKSYGISYNGKIIEKPRYVKRLFPLLGLGIYMADYNFYDYINKTKTGMRGEVEITDTLESISKDRINFHELKGFYANVNTVHELKTARNGGM